MPTRTFLFSLVVFGITTGRMSHAQINVDANAGQREQIKSGPNRIAPEANHFPPILVQKEAASWTLENQQTLEETAKRKPMCKKLQQRYLAMVREAERVARMPDQALFLRQAVALQERIGKLDDPACPEMKSQLKLLGAYIEEQKALYPSMHAAEPDKKFKPEKATHRKRIDLLAQFNELHDTACANAAFAQQLSAKMWCKGASNADATTRPQRYLLNLSSDRALVRRDGSVGISSKDDDFVALVETKNCVEGDKQVAYLQGQGPIAAADIERYIDASVNYAQKQNLQHVLFVNAAEGAGQIPSFAKQVETRSPSLNINLKYMGTASWADGSLISPADAAKLAKSIYDKIHEASGGVLLVFNCNAGLDRSGILNVLVQLIGETERQRVKSHDKAQLLRFGYALIPQLVGNVKHARAHSISTLARYWFIHQAFEAYIEQLAP